MSVRAAVIVNVVLTMGCSGDGPPPGDDIDAPDVDVPPAPTSCTSSEPFLSETPLAITHAGAVVFPSGLSSDELTAYYTIDRAPGDAVIYATARADRDQPFVAGSPVPGVNTVRAEFGAVVSSDGRELYFAREDMPGIQTRIYRAFRADPAAPFGAAAPLSSLDPLTMAPSVTVDGTELFYRHFWSNTSSFPEIYQAKRLAVGASFSGSRLLAAQVPDEYGRPVISGDGLTLYFTRLEGGIGAISYLRRPLPGGPWSGPDRLPASDGASPLWESPDSCRLYVARAGQVVVLSRR